MKERNYEKEMVKNERPKLRSGEKQHSWEKEKNRREKKKKKKAIRKVAKELKVELTVGMMKIEGR